MNQSITALRPGISVGDYPERDHGRRGTANLLGPLHQLWWPRKVRAGALHAFVRLIVENRKTWSNASLAELQQRLPQLRERLLRDGFVADAVAPLFALLSRVSQHTIGKRYYDVQFMGGWAMLNGMLIEMQTGEGKSLTATLPACTAALLGVPVHIISVNDYLVERDAEAFRPLYEAMGLSVGCIRESMDAAARRAAWQCDIVYCSSRQLVFDYLKDRLTRAPSRTRRQGVGDPTAAAARPLMRGLCYAIVDEADSVLIDEARTPLILSTAQTLVEQPTLYRDVLLTAARLDARDDFHIDRAAGRIDVTEHGRDRIESLAGALPPPWSARQAREYLLTQALTALHLYRRDQQYVVRNQRVTIVDTNTGRVMPDHRWEGGLQQLIEAKEGVPLSPVNEPLAKICYQRFFPRYLRLAGMTGTAAEVRGELWDTYRLRTVRIPTRRPCQLRELPLQFYADAPTRMAALLAHVQGVHAEGRPVLIGTATVAQSTAVSEGLRALGLPHQVLNANTPLHEAQIIAAAGKAGRITVATNMAGRGTDIRLGPGVPERGGLHVVSAEPNRSSRIDRQLAGRAARQGDPGSYIAFAASSDETLSPAGSSFPLLRIGGSNRLSRWLVRAAQWQHERRDANARQLTRAQDEQAARSLAFAGRAE